MAQDRNDELRQRDFVNCQLCTSMISVEGFEKIASSTGFKHRNRKDSIQTAEDGCLVCEILVKDSMSLGRGSNYEAPTFVARPAQYINRESQLFDELYVDRHGGSPQPELCLYTNEGSYMSTRLATRPYPVSGVERSDLNTHYR